MVDVRLVQAIASSRPKLNPDICEGLPLLHIREVEEYINDIFRSAAESLPPQLKYVGPERCTPYEEYKEIIRPLKPKRSFELARSDIYLMKYNFTFNGVPLRPRYIFLPIISDGSIIHLKGTQYKVSPVLGGRAFNIERGIIFMNTPRARLTFNKTPVSFILNRQISHADIVYSPMYNMSATDRSKLVSSLVHYQLAEYGLHGMMKRYYNTDIKVGYEELDELIGTGEWYVFASRQLPPIGRGKNKFNPSAIRIAVKAEDYKPIFNSVLGAVFYIIDNFPESIQAEDTIHSDLWLRLLSRFIFKTPDTERKMYEEMLNHLNSIRHYMDPITKKVLEKEKIPNRDIFDLFQYLVNNFHDIVIHHDVGSMYNLELTTTKHVVYDIVHNIFMMMFELMKLTGDRVTQKNVTEIMDKILRRDKILNTKKHGEYSADGIASDCKPYAATCNLISQTKAAGKNQKHQNQMEDPSLLLHHSQVEVASYQMMSKAEPSGRSKANPFMTLIGKSYVIQNPNMVDYVEHLKTLLKH